jgi:hypothetical protein
LFEKTSNKIQNGLPGLLPVVAVDIIGFEMILEIIDYD